MEFFETIRPYLEDGAKWLALLSVIVEFTPIKLSPISWLLKKAGTVMNSEIIERMNRLEAKLVEQDVKIDNNEKDRLRFEILDFASSCRSGRMHTIEEFDHILEQYDKYEVILAKLEQPNGKTTQAMKYVTSLYDQNDFLEA